MPKRTHAPQSRHKKTQSCARTPVKRPKGWRACTKFLSGTSEPKLRASNGHDQLLRIIQSSHVLNGVEAEVNWYSGGNSYVALPASVAEVMPGVYLAKARFTPRRHHADDESGPQAKTASIWHLRLLGTAGEFITATKENRKTLGRTKTSRLIQMLSEPIQSSPDVEEQ